MFERRRKFRIILLHIILLPTVLFAFYFFTLAPRPYVGVDEAVVEKIAAEHGHVPRRALFEPGSDLLLFLFLCAGAAGGFVAGYYWRKLGEKHSDDVSKGH